jgi:hypothetical protein
MTTWAADWLGDVAADDKRLGVPDAGEGSRGWHGAEIGDVWDRPGKAEAVEVPDEVRTCGEERSSERWRRKALVGERRKPSVLWALKSAVEPTIVVGGGQEGARSRRSSAPATQPTVIQICVAAV